MNINKCIVGLVALLGFWSACAAKQPNIVVVVADDMGWGDSATYGHELIQTPNMDKLATQGMKLTQCYSAQLVAAEARHWLKDLRAPAKPIALSVWMHEPHSPIATDSRFQSLYQGHKNSKYMGNITQLDHALGMVMDALDELSLSENTWLFFTSDNGPVPAYGGTSGGLRGNKRSEYEGGIRVPGLPEAGR